MFITTIAQNLLEKIRIFSGKPRLYCNPCGMNTGASIRRDRVTSLSLSFSFSLSLYRASTVGISYSMNQSAHARIAVIRQLNYDLQSRTC